MKKSVYFICFFLVFTLLLPACSRITNMVEVDREKIGAEYTSIQKTNNVANGKYGIAKNYKSSLNEDIWTTSFDYMNATSYEHFVIGTDDALLIDNKIENGEVWIKITQGDLSLSSIQKVRATNNDVTKVDLSQWENGELAVWLVVEKGENGAIQIEHIKN